MKSDLFFQLRVQEFVELIKADTISEALSHAREKVARLRDEVFDLLIGGSVLQACDDLPWMCRCHENGVKLKRMKSDFVFQLRVQEFVELIKADAIAEALAHAREKLVPFAEEHFGCFKRVVALLVFRKGTRCERYQYLLDDGRWEKLGTQFLSELLRANNLSSVPLLELQLQVRHIH
jgi:hypothetical protein